MIKTYNKFKNTWLKKHSWVELGNGVIFDINSRILGTPLMVKNHTTFQGLISAKGNAPIAIGHHCLIGENLFILTSTELLKKEDLIGEKKLPYTNQTGPVYIGNNVSIGSNVIILPGVSIGDGSIVNSNSIVRDDVQPYEIVSGSPSKRLRFRFSNKTIKKLLSTQSWYFDKDENNNLIVSEIDMSNSQSFNFLTSGWGSKESNYRWVQQKEAGFVFKIRRQTDYSKLLLSCYSYHKPQICTVFVNGKQITKLKISTKLKDYRIKIDYLNNGINSFSLRFSKSYTPYLIDQNLKDTRKLYCCFTLLKLI